MHIGLPMLMGVLNVTPDSFSDGGKYTDLPAAVARARSMVSNGADCIDVGGESTRPGSEPVSDDVEKRRVIPVIRSLRESPHAKYLYRYLKTSVRRQPSRPARLW